jgi:hypothetical protein
VSPNTEQIAPESKAWTLVNCFTYPWGNEIIDMPPAFRTDRNRGAKNGWNFRHCNAYDYALVIEGVMHPLYQINPSLSLKNHAKSFKLTITMLHLISFHFRRQGRTVNIWHGPIR